MTFKKTNQLIFKYVEADSKFKRKNCENHDEGNNKLERD